MSAPLAARRGEGRSGAMYFLKLYGKAKKRARNLAFRMACRDVLRTPPLAPRPADLLIVSMVSHIDLILYLVAIKSFYPRIGRGEIAVIDDGSLTRRDRRILRHHISPCRIVPVGDIHLAGCPQYVSWKRLAFIAGRLAGRYVVQLDSDTLTFGDLPEVSAAIAGGENFILGTSTGRSVGTMADACERWRGLPVSQYPQALAERNFDKIDGYRSLRYLRGNAAFTGFSKGAFSHSDVIDVSAKMEKIVGPRWHQWGSEQVTVNYLVSNAGTTNVLPYPNYTGYYPEHDIPFAQALFIHFTGLNRYRNGYYRRRASQIIEGMLRQRVEG